MLTDRGLFALALAAGGYVTAWAFGSVPLYPLSVGLLLAVVGAVGYVLLVGRPASLSRRIPGRAHVAGEDVPVSLELPLRGVVRPRSLTAVERPGGLPPVEVSLHRRAGTLRGDYVIERAPRGRYPFAETSVVVEDPFGLGRAERAVHATGSLLVRPRLLELGPLFSDSGSQNRDGRRVALRRPTGFDLYSVREYEQGESLRRVHWPSTARRGRLMVKDLEDSPRDEALVVLDADASFVTGEGSGSSFETAVTAAGSILRAHVARGRRAGLLVNGRVAQHCPVRTLEGEWESTLDLLATVEPDGRTPVASLLSDGIGPAGRALELCIVTSGLSARLAERLVQRSITRRGASIVLVELSSFVPGREPGPPAETKALLTRLGHAGIPVCVLRSGDDLAERLAQQGPQALASGRAARAAG